MAWIYLDDGWRDESSEGPFTEILQTKGPYTIVQHAELYRKDDLIHIKHRDFREPIGKSRTVDQAKDFVKQHMENNRGT